MAIWSAFFVIAQWALVAYFADGHEVNNIWSLLLPAYFLTPLTLVLLLLDARWHLLPNRLMFPGAIGLLLLVSILAIASGDFFALLRVWVLALGAGLVLLLASLFGLGMGDVKLGVILSAWLGLYGWFGPVIMLCLASVLGGMFALVAILSHKANLKSHIAFGPWMIASAYITWILYLPSLLR